MAEVKKILVVIFMISIITTSLYMLLPGNEIFEASPPENSITAQEFFADNYYFSPYNQNDNLFMTHAQKEDPYNLANNNYL